MSLATVVFAVVIVFCTTGSILATALNVKLGRVELMLREIETNPEQEDARLKYEAAVDVYNNAITRFPGFLIAGVLGFENITAESRES